MYYHGNHSYHGLSVFSLRRVRMALLYRRSTLPCSKSLRYDMQTAYTLYSSIFYVTMLLGVVKRFSRTRYTGVYLFDNPIVSTVPCVPSRKRSGGGHAE